MQLQVLGSYLRALNKTIKPVVRNGLCILSSVREVSLEADINRSIAELKDILRTEIKENIGIYKVCLTNDVDVCAEIEKFFIDPTAEYVRDSVDLVLPALCRALHIKGTIYTIDRKGQITTMPVGRMDDWKIVAEFARSEILHIDPVVKYLSQEKHSIKKELSDGQKFSSAYVINNCLGQTRYPGMF